MKQTAKDPYNNRITAENPDFIYRKGCPKLILQVVGIAY